MADSNRQGEPATGGRDPLEHLRDLIGVPVDDDFADIPTPTRWPDIPSTDVADQWDQLRAWVDSLCRRFSHLDHHAIPRCWWRHNGHVEALAALRDHERSSFSDTAPATAPIDWLRALRDITALLKAWTADVGCGATHQTPTATLRSIDGNEWQTFVETDVATRQGREIQTSVTDELPDLVATVGVVTSDSRTQFAAQVSAFAAQLLGAHVEQLPQQYTLRISPPHAESSVLHLENLFSETQMLSDEQRAVRVRAAVQAVISTVRPNTWRDAADRLLPAVRTRTSLIRYGANIVRRPLAPFVDVAVTLDLSDTLWFVTTDDLSNWGVDTETAHDAARRNLHETGLELESAERGFAVFEPPSYGSSWLASPALLEEVSTSAEMAGPFVALVPSRDALRLIPLRDVDAVLAGIDRALVDFAEEPRSISPVPYVFIADEIRPWDPPAMHPGHELVRQASRVLAHRAYGEQQELLQESFRNASDPTRVASHMVVTHKDDGHMWSWTLWSAEPGESLIPQVDYVLLFDPRRPETPFAVAWPNLLQHAANRVRQEPGYVARFGVPLVLQAKS